MAATPPRVAPIEVHIDDLPDNLNLGSVVAIDSETMGLKLARDRLCVVQLFGSDGTAHLVHFKNRDYSAPNLKRLLTDPAVTKIFHFARFDVAAFQQYLGVATAPIFCTKIASKLVRTFSDRHGLKELVKEITGVELSKQQQSSDWGALTLTAEQQHYAASDVLYLHELKDELTKRLEREGKLALAEACFAFLPTRAALDLLGWEEPTDIFSHT